MLVVLPSRLWPIYGSVPAGNVESVMYPRYVDRWPKAENDIKAIAKSKSLRMCVVYYPIKTIK